MATPPYLEVDYLEEARDRITEAFKGKDIIDRYLQLLIDQQQDLQQVFKDLLQKRSIDEATGATLDIIGEIVGQPRELISADLFNFFGFQGALKADTFGDFGQPQIGSKFYDFGTPFGGNVLLDDETYRLFIKAKILKNTTASTPEEFLTFINFMFGTTTTALLEEGDAEYIVLFGRELSIFEQTLLNYVSTSQGYPSRLIPKTVGVRVNFGWFEADNYFGFQGAPGAKGFGDLTGTYGYGLGYGLEYGDSNFGLGVPTWEPSYDGDEDYDGSSSYSSVATYPTSSQLGGIFATLF